MQWGGISALAFVGLFSISIATGWITGAGITFRAWVPLWSILVCFLVVAALAGYEYLARTQYALARIGLAFAALTIIFFFLEGVVWGADRIVLRVEMPAESPNSSHLLVLFGSLHKAVFWFVGLWMGFWGAGFVQHRGRAKVMGILMLLKVPTNAVDYSLARLELTGPLIDLYHLGSQIVLLSAFALLGLVLVETSRTGDRLTDR